MDVTTPLDPYSNFSLAHALEAVSVEADAGVSTAWGSLDAGRPQMIGLWRWDAAGPFVLITNPSIPVPPDSPRDARGLTNFGSGSDDLKVVVFTSHKRLIEDAPSNIDSLSFPYLYRWFDGNLSMVGVLPDGGGIAPAAALGYGPVDAQGVYPGEGAVSGDGSRVFFTTRPSPFDPERELYRRDDDPRDGVEGTTDHVSISERTDCAGDVSCGGDGIPTPLPDPETPAAVQFELASGDGSRAVFASPRKLTDDATANIGAGPGGLNGNDYCSLVQCDLYLWDDGAPDGHRVTDLTTADAGGGGVVAAVGSSDDVRRVYFVAAGVLAAGGVAGEPNLYLWEEGEGVRLVAVLDSSINGVGGVSDRGVWSHDVGSGKGPDDGGFRDVRVSDGGRFAAFRSRAVGLAARGFDTAGHYEVYRFDAATDAVVCVSCVGAAGTSVGDAFLKRHRVSAIRLPWLSRNVSSGGRVVFDSREELVPADGNGRVDVYEWADGVVRLVSSGWDSDDSGFLDASVDGTDVFFTTRGRLVKSDVDDLVDLYDARVGGGFPESERRVCHGDPCQGPVPDAPGVPEFGSVTVRGRDDAKHAAKPRARRVVCRRGFVRKRVHKKVRCVKKPRKAARHGGRTGR